MASTKPVIVIATGAWHVPQHYEPMAKPLREAGFEVYCQKHQSIGIPKDPGNMLERDASALAEVLNRYLDDGKDVIFIMHSYGGIAGSEAVGMVCEDKANRTGGGRIRRLIYLAAHALDKGKPFREPGTLVSGSDVNEDGMMMQRTPYDRYYSDVSREEAAPAIALLEPMAVSAMQTPAKYCGWKDYGIPVTYVKCSKDVAVTPEMGDAYIEKMKSVGVDVSGETIDAGHCQHWTAPSLVVGIIEKVAAL